MECDGATAEANGLSKLLQQDVDGFDGTLSLRLRCCAARPLADVISSGIAMMIFLNDNFLLANTVTDVAENSVTHGKGVVGVQPQGGNSLLEHTQISVRYAGHRRTFRRRTVAKGQRSIRIERNIQVSHQAEQKKSRMFLFHGLARIADSKQPLMTWRAIASNDQQDRSP